MGDVDHGALERAMVALGSAGLEPEQMQLLMSRLVVSKEDLKEEVAQEIRQEIEGEFELSADAGFEINFDDLDTGETVTLGVGKHETKIPVRYLVQGDFERLSKLIPDVVRFVYKKGPSKLQEITSAQLLTDVLLLVRNAKNINKFILAFYREMAICLVSGRIESDPSKDPAVIAMADFLRTKCLPSQIYEAGRKIYEENQRFFTDLWRALPGDIATAIATIFGTIMSNIKNLAQMSLALSQDSSGTGTTLNGGLMSLLTRFAQSTDGQQKQSETWTSQPSGDLENPLEEDQTEKATLSGETQKTDLILAEGESVSV